MAIESGYIEVTKYVPQRHPDTGEQVHQRVLLNGSHIVAVEQVFLPDVGKELKTVDSTLVKMFGMAELRVKETVEQISEAMSAAGFTMRVVGK